ncbi:MAG: aa3-type cytochrome c oxidase subunit IV [Rhodobacteraceae bacterium]|nr:aa3-type cytochrome c oxidase subunit IV [Paracoccaceae bacterium]
MAEHKPGTMEIRTQEKTFAGFVRFVTWSVVLIIAILIFMALVNA